MNKLKEDKGVTLVALLITIIVMLILLVVVVDMTVEGDIFNMAGNAVEEANGKTQEEQNRVDNLMQKFDEI